MRHSLWTIAAVTWPPHLISVQYSLPWLGEHCCWLLSETRSLNSCCWYWTIAHILSFLGISPSRSQYQWLSRSPSLGDAWDTVSNQLLFVLGTNNITTAFFPSCLLPRHSSQKLRLLFFQEPQVFQHVDNVFSSRFVYGGNTGLMLKLKHWAERKSHTAITFIVIDMICPNPA